MFYIVIVDYTHNRFNKDFYEAIEILVYFIFDTLFIKGPGALLSILSFPCHPLLRQFGFVINQTSTPLISAEKP